MEISFYTGGEHDGSGLPHAHTSSSFKVNIYIIIIIQYNNFLFIVESYR
jgi:hypothetical protein